MVIADHSVRPLTPAHEMELQQLYESCREYMLLVTGADPDPSEAAQLLGALPPSVPADRKLVLGLWSQGHRLLAAVDVIKGFPRNESWYIGELIVAPDARGRGLGRGLYCEVRERAGSAGANSIGLAVHEGNAAALTFWTSMGFEQTGRTAHRVKSLESMFVLMRAELPSRRA